MKNSIQTVQTQGTVAIIDDDVDTAEAIAMMVSDQFPVHVFTSSNEAKQRLTEANDRLLEEQQYLKELVESESSADLGEIAAWLRSRQPEIEVCFCDYDLKLENGVELLSSIKHSMIRRIIITGIASDSIAIQAFNDGNIDGFLRKGKDLSLTELAVMGAKRSDLRCDDPDIAKIIHDHNAAKAVKQYLKDLGIVDHILLCRPFGIMGKCDDGQIKWIHMECKETLADTIAFHEEEGLPKEDLDLISTGHMGMCNELSNAFPEAIKSPPRMKMKVICEAPWIAAGDYTVPEN